MERPVIKRLFAYFIDIVIVFIITSMFSGLRILNPEYDNYNDHVNGLMNLIIAESNITNETNESNEQKEELNETEENTTNETTNNAQVILSEEDSYKISYYGRYISLISLIVTVLYFVLFQFLNKGKTIGKALLKIELVSKEGKLKFWQVATRSLINNSIVTSAVSCITLFVCSQSTYLAISKYVELIDMALLFICLAMMMVREDARGLHDILVGTEVLFNSDKDKRDLEPKEAVVEEKNHVINKDSKVTTKANRKSKTNKEKKVTKNENSNRK